MLTPDETHHEPANIHDEVAAKTGETPSADTHGADDAHGAHDDAGHGPQAAAGTFIEENSPQDMFLSFLAGVAGLGLIFMMYMFYVAPIDVELAEHAAPVAPVQQAPAVTPGEQVPVSPPIR